MILDELNPKQREAVEQTEGPVLILAGAGSGKTRVLTYRMAHLLQTKNIRPWNLFSVTFTNKAAAEMRERIEKLLHIPARELWVSTFHSSCLRILRRNADKLNYKSDFTIYDDRDQLQVITEALTELKIDPTRVNPKMVAFKINQAKNNGLTPEAYARVVDDFLSEKIVLAYTHYQKKLLINQAMDFGDLIFNVVRLFKDNPQVLQFYQDQFRYIHVDEYQDTNRCQYELMKLLSSSHRNLCVVGDDDQSIYKFRGAEIKNILDFQKDYSDATIIRLEQNYRSTQNILNAAGAVVAKNKSRMGKTLWTENGAGEKITLYGGAAETDEAEFVVGEILKEKQSYPLSKMALFYRTNAQSRPFEDELRRHRIPYVIVGGTRFYDRQEIKDLLSYFKVLVNPADPIGLKRIINVPARGIGKTTLERLEAHATEKGISLWDLLLQLTRPQANENSLLPSLLPQSSSVDLSAIGLSKGSLAKLSVFVELIENLNQDRASIPLMDLIQAVIDKSGYWNFLKEQNTVEADGRMENIEELVNVVEEYDKRMRLEETEPTLEGFLDQAALVSDTDTEDASTERLSLMTFHLAKGLEYPIVFMVGMEEGLVPHSRSLELAEDIEEERRLCYVGMTRAMKNLTLSYVQRRRLFGRDEYHVPSRFLDDIPSDLLNPIGTAENSNDVQTFVDDELPVWSSSASRSLTTNQGYSSQTSTIKKSVKNSRETVVDYSYDQTPTWSPSPFTKGTKTNGAVIRRSAPDVSASSVSHNNYQRGMRVLHPQFGEGIIKLSEGSRGDEKLTIAFSGGQSKTILAKYTQLAIL